MLVSKKLKLDHLPVCQKVISSLREYSTRPKESFLISNLTLLQAQCEIFHYFSATINSAHNLCLVLGSHLTMSDHVRFVIRLAHLHLMREMIHSLTTASVLAFVSLCL